MSLLEKQPKPQGGGEAVWPSLSPRIMRDRLWTLLNERHEQGLEKYGQDLMTFDGRDPWADLIQELVDAVFYAERLRMEGGPDFVYVLQVLTETILDQAPQTPVVGTETTLAPLRDRRLPSR
jgi:hypothetical protein